MESLQKAIEHARANALALQKQYDFRPDYGWSQVEGKDTQTKVDYGCYTAYLAVCEIAAR